MPRQEQYVAGQLVAVVDYRTLADAQAERLALIREEAARRILAAAPQYKQNNAALGLLPAEESIALRAAIQAIRDASNALEAEIEAAATNDQVDAVAWRD